METQTEYRIPELALEAPTRQFVLEYQTTIAEVLNQLRESLDEFTDADLERGWEFAKLCLQELQQRRQNEGHCPSDTIRLASN